MSIDYRTLLADTLCAPAEPVTHEFLLADDILATRIPDLCPDCDQGDVKHLPYSQTCTHSNAPTIADLLRWGENVARGDLALTLLHAIDGTPVPDKYEMTGRDLEVLANACLAALRTEADR